MKAENHAKAPICARVVSDFRAVFGEGVKVERICEGEVQYGKPDERVYASCYVTWSEKP